MKAEMLKVGGGRAFCIEKDGIVAALFLYVHEMCEECVQDALSLVGARDGKAAQGVPVAAACCVSSKMAQV